ncbi:hypothetical protein [Micromonospora sp. NBC_00421]|uniref:hypothetical protein n=1 Tax=Micromonospora sp. NBC_00421 TaxID=2975976 RepID=UPI002E200A8B
MPTTRITAEATVVVTGASGGIDATPARPVPRPGVAVGTAAAVGTTIAPGRPGRAGPR